MSLQLAQQSSMHQVALEVVVEEEADDDDNDDDALEDTSMDDVQFLERKQFNASADF